MIFDATCRRLMVVDFERSAVVSRPALAPMTSNGKAGQTVKKRFRVSSAEDELAALRNCMHRYLR